VSVLTPVYGQAAFLPRAVASLRAQDRPDWELVVVDDGSPDDVAAALPRDARVRLLRLGANHGLGRALNAGLAAARAPVIAWTRSTARFITACRSRPLAAIRFWASMIASNLWL
jgi:glycosyltransferase involved in cell wall biosynthesis